MTLIASTVNFIVLGHCQSKIVLFRTRLSNDMAIRPRVTITLDEEVFNKLTALADEQERTPANLAAYIVAKFIKELPDNQPKS